jgi:hypothetical protein
MAQRLVILAAQIKHDKPSLTHSQTVSFCNVTCISSPLHDSITFAIDYQAQIAEQKAPNVQSSSSEMPSSTVGGHANLYD